MHRLIASSLRCPALALAPLAAATARRSVSFANANSTSGRRPRSEGSGFQWGGRPPSTASSSLKSSATGGRRDRGRAYGGPIKDRYPPMLVDRQDPRRRLAVLVDGSNTSLLRTGGDTSLGVEGGGDGAAALRQRSPLYTSVLPAILKVGVPVLLRVFAHELPSEWGPLLAGTPAFAEIGDAGAARPSSSPSNAPATLLPLPSSDATETAQQIQFEFFRVERFIPIPMQIEADAQHLFDFRRENLIEGVCYVCHEVDRGVYESIMEEQLSGAFLSTTAAAAATQATAWLSSARPEASALHSAEGGATEAPGVAESAAFFNQYLVDELGMVKEVNTDRRPGDGSS